MAKGQKKTLKNGKGTEKNTKEWQRDRKTLKNGKGTEGESRALAIPALGVQSPRPHGRDNLRALQRGGCLRVPLPFFSVFSVPLPFFSVFESPFAIL